MTRFYIRTICIFSIICTLASCANIVPPTGGKKDVVPPKLVKITPKDSLLNTRVTKIEMVFDEFVTLNDPSKEIQISPVIPFPLTTVLAAKKLTIEIPDSLLKDSTTYRINFGKSIKDLNENNEFENFNYIFSTGSYFDSLKLTGIVYTAATGKPAADMSIVLYEAGLSDSAVVKQKPMYVTKTNGSGNFVMPGLPCKAFRIYALKDANENLVYDGDEEEIGFVDSIIFPMDSVTSSVVLRLFKEIPPIDTLDDQDSLKKVKPTFKGRKKGTRFDDNELRYTIAVDTNDTAKRTYDINKPVKITFSSPIDTFNSSRISLVRDSAGIELESAFTIERDTTEEGFLLNSTWQDNTLYTIKVFKDFATDTSKNTSLPSAHTFRTKSDIDYGLIKVNVAAAYTSDKHILQVISGSDTIYNKGITDSTVTVKRLLPGKYELYIVVDENKNGKWDTGDLFAKLQPEYVLPYPDVIELKAGWENVLDFKEPVKEKVKDKIKASRERRDKPPTK